MYMNAPHGGTKVLLSDYYHTILSRVLDELKVKKPATDLSEYKWAVTLSAFWDLRSLTIIQDAALKLGINIEKSLLFVREDDAAARYCISTLCQAQPL